jgi:hypothetical protein
MNSTQEFLSGGRQGRARERGREFEPGKAEECVEPGQQADQNDLDCCVHYLNEPVAIVSGTKASQSVTTADLEGLSSLKDAGLFG